MLSQGEPRDAAVNLDSYDIKFYHGIIRAISLPQHGFLAGHSLSADCSESYVSQSVFELSILCLLCCLEKWLTLCALFLILGLLLFCTILW